MPRYFQKLLSIIFVLCISLIFTGRAHAFSGAGAGTSGDPFQITTCDQLQEMSDALAADYLLMNDIDCSATSGWNAGEGFEPIGDGSNFPTSYFTGTLDGQEFVISNLFINRTVTENVGFFGLIGDGTEISNIGMQNVDITGNRNTGGLVGAVDGSSGINITNAYTTGSVTGTDVLVGGLIGNNDAATITESYSTAAVTGEEDVGGLIGDNYGDISRSFATGDVTASTGEWVGGLLGYNDGGTITDVYATGDVDAGVVFSGVGGLIGQNSSGSITNAYSTGAVTVAGSVTGNVGGFVGDNQDTVAASFWDTETSGLVDGCGTGSANCNGVSSKTTAEMKDSTTFTAAGWDFTTIWDINGTDNNGYPFFRWQFLSSPSPTPTPAPQQSSSSSGGGGSAQAPSCGDSAPTNAPDLFQIDVTNTKAMLYFVPSQNANKYFVSFGNYDNAEGYGVEFPYADSSGAILYTINDLAPNTSYWVKVRSGNGCMPGDWGNTMQIKTRNTASGGTSFYKNFASRILSVLPRSLSNAGSGQVQGASTKAQSSGNTCEYIVKSGESLWTIASSELGSGAKYKDIMTENDLPSTSLKIGQKLQVGC